jgi:hypothetical protein
MSRTYSSRFRRWSDNLPDVHPAAYVCGALLVAALVFQLFFRYAYFETKGSIWRVDRVTQRGCRVSVGQCIAAQ